MMMIMIDRSEYDDDVVATDQKVKVLKMLLLIENSKCWRCCWSKGQNAKDVVADRTVKVPKMLLIERSKWWRCRCWLKDQNVEDVVADRIVKVMKMLLIKRSKCWRCRCWLKDQNAEDVADQSSQRINDDEEWRLKMKTTLCWKASNYL